MLEELKKDLEGLSGRVCLLWSGGLDSTLLLAVLRELGKPFDICQMREYLTREQRARSDDLIKRWDLTVFTYPFANCYLIGKHWERKDYPHNADDFLFNNNTELSVIFEYAVGNTILPNIRDIIHGSRCIADFDNAIRTPVAPIVWDTYIVGSRRTDSHYAVRQAVPSKSWTDKGTHFFAPLFEWTRDEVKSALKSYGLESEEVSAAEDTGHIALCTNCIAGKGKVFCPKDNREIDSVNWDAEENLKAFQTKYGF